jgi:hypothetical protein
MSAVINAAITHNPGAVIDARCFAAYATGTTPQKWSMNIFNSVTTPGELLLGVVNVDVSAQQSVPSGWRIVGAGPGVTVLRAVSNSSGNGPNQIELPIQIQDSVGVWLTHSYIHDSSSSNVGIDTNNPTGGGSSNVHIEANRIGVTHGCGTFDVQAGPVTKDFYIKDNFIFGANCYGIGADGSSYGVISGNDISAAGNSANSGGGIQIEGTNGNPSHLVISNNIVHDFTATSTAFGIAFVLGNSNRTISDVLIDGNIVANYQGRGIYVGAGGVFSNIVCRNVTVKGNTIHDTTLAGIRVVGCNIAQVEGNSIYNVGTAHPGNDDQDGIAITNTTAFAVVGNIITDVPPNLTTRYGVNLDGTSGDGFVVSNYAKGTGAAPINNSASGSDIQVLTNHTN